LDDILTGVAIALLLAVSGSYYWQQRPERTVDQSRSAGDLFQGPDVICNPPPPYRGFRGR
jgi:hypothetical protein